MDEGKQGKKGRTFNTVVIVLLSVIALCGIGSGVYNYSRYAAVQSNIDDASGGELQRKLDDVTAELERTKSALAESQQSVGELEELNRQWAAGTERIERSVESIGEGIRNAKSGNERTEIALRGIAEIVGILEAEFGGSSK